MKANLNAEINHTYSMTLNRKSQGHDHTESLHFNEIWSKSIYMQSIMLVIIYMNEANLTQRITTLLRDLEQKSQGQGNTERLQLKRSDQGL